MMSSLFESFDPLTSFLNSNLLILLAPILTPIFKNLFSWETSRNPKLLLTIQKTMFSELEASLNNKNKKNKTLILFSLFLFILILNLAGLMPYVYTLTSQMLFTLSMALPLWISFILFSIWHNTEHFISHLVPLSTPLPLSQFMTLIETISLSIRPLTLSVRLCANMTAGHILMALSSGPIFMLNSFSLILLVLLLLEVAVAFIQSYVFSMLLSMYLSETY